MSVLVTETAIVLDGVCSVEDAEPLLAALTAFPELPVDARSLLRAHLAVVQLLHAAHAKIAECPEDSFLRHHAFAGLTRINP